MTSSSVQSSHVRPTFELRDRNYIVTGGAQGIGFALTRAICEMGGNVAVLDIQEQPVKEFDSLKDEFGTKVLYFKTDVTNQQSLETSFKSAVRELGSIDGCVPCAGIAIDKPFLDQTWDEFTRIQEINVRTFPVSHLYGSEMRINPRYTLGSRHILHRTACC